MTEAIMFKLNHFDTHAGYDRKDGSYTLVRSCKYVIYREDGTASHINGEAGDKIYGYVQVVSESSGAFYLAALNDVPWDDRLIWP